MVLAVVEETDIKQKNYEYSRITNYIGSINGEKVYFEWA